MLCAGSVLGLRDLSLNKRDSLPDLKHKVFASLTVTVLYWVWTYLIFTSICWMNTWKLPSLYFSHLLLVSSLPPPLSPASLPIPCTATLSPLHTLLFSDHFCVNNFQTYLSCLCQVQFHISTCWLETSKLICQLRNKTHSKSSSHLPLTNVLLLLTFIFVWAQLMFFPVTHLQDPHISSSAKFSLPLKFLSCPCPHLYVLLSTQFWALLSPT